MEERTYLYIWRQGLNEPLTRIRNSSVTVPLKKAIINFLLG